MLPVAILAGGLATRLRPVSEKIPKSLVEVAGEPFINHQLRLLRKNHIRQVVLCVGHLGEMIRDQIGSGESFGMTVRYSFDGPTLLGTGGALRRAGEYLGDAFFVLYGDSYLECDYASIQDAFYRGGKPALMTVYQNGGLYDKSNVVLRDGEIALYDKNVHHPDMQWIDYGLGVLSASVLRRILPDSRVDLANIYGELVKEKQLAGYEVGQRFYEIGSFSGMEELSDHLSPQKNCRQSIYPDFDASS